MNAMHLENYELMRATIDLNREQLEEDLESIDCLSEIAASCSSAAYVTLSDGGKLNKDEVAAITAAASIISKLSQNTSNIVTNKVQSKKPE